MNTSMEDILIEDYNLNLVLSKEGYLKKITPISLRSSGEHKLKENDEIIYQCPCMNNAELLVFNNNPPLTGA